MIEIWIQNPGSPGKRTATAGGGRDSAKKLKLNTGKPSAAPETSSGKKFKAELEAESPVSEQETTSWLK